MIFKKRPTRTYCFLSAMIAMGCVFLAPARGQSPSPAGDPPSPQSAGNTAQSPAESGSASTSTPSTPAPQDQEPPGGKRIFGVLPNYRTADASLESTTLTPKQKLTIATKDSFDYPLILLSGALAGLDQLADENPSFGQGVKGYAKQLGANYASQALGNMFTEGLFPVMLHEDPRYFRRGPSYGGVGKRTWYALTRVIVTKKDSGGYTFNYSEWLGNASAVAISNTYYPDNRTALDNSEELVEQVGIDAVSQVLKEFWPDIKHKLFHKGSPE